jgi:hypothetical protein
MGIYFSRPAYVIEEPVLPLFVDEGAIIYDNDVVILENNGVYYGGGRIDLNKLKIVDLKNLSKKLKISNKISNKLNKKELLMKIKRKLKNNK